MSPTLRAPFQQLRFSELPERPRLPHPYASTPARELQLDLEHFARDHKLRATPSALGCRSISIP